MVSFGEFMQRMAATQNQSGPAGPQMGLSGSPGAAYLPMTQSQQVTAGRIANDANSRGGVPDTGTSYGVPMNLNSIARPGDNLTAQLGGLFGSTDYSWGPSGPTHEQHPLPDVPVGRKPSTPFAEFMSRLMFGDSKDEHGRRVGTQDPMLWGQIAPYLERAYSAAPTWRNDPDMQEILSHIATPPSSTYQSRQDNKFLTPEQRGDEWTQQYGPFMDEYNRRIDAGYAPPTQHGAFEGTVNKNWRYDQLMWNTAKMLQDLFP